MSSDTGAPEQPSASYGLWRLPTIVDVQVRRVRYTPPKPHAVGSRIVESDAAVEFLVRTSEDFPERALGPALFVGTTEIDESERVGDQLYRFIAYAPHPLRKRAVLSLGWSGQPGRRQRSPFHYELGSENAGDA